jgi:uncharacterized protein YndB with AHSA1/START domain
MKSDDEDRTHRAHCLVPAPPEVVYEALVSPQQLVRWLPPRGATGHIDLFEPRAGGRIRITLVFAAAAGKSSANTDVVEGRFVALAPGEGVVQAFSFASDDPRFAGEMTMTWELHAAPGGTQVQVTASNVPAGIAREEHERGMASSLENLRAWLAA